MSIQVLIGQGTPTVPSPGEYLPTCGLRMYPSAATDTRVWQLLRPLVHFGGTVPDRGGRPVSYPRRVNVDAIRYLVRTGCQWGSLPAAFPAALVKHYFTVWTRDGTLNQLHNTLREQVRQVEGRSQAISPLPEKVSEC